MIADKAFNTDTRVLEPLAQAGKAAVIPLRPTAESSRTTTVTSTRERHPIENVFAKLKQFRAIVARCDKTTRNFLGAIHLAVTAIWLS